MLKRADEDGSALCACYFDNPEDNELLYIALRPSDASCVAFGADGRELTLGAEGPNGVLSALDPHTTGLSPSTLLCLFALLTQRSWVAARHCSVPHRPCQS